MNTKKLTTAMLIALPAAPATRNISAACSATAVTRQCSSIKYY